MKKRPASLKRRLLTVTVLCWIIPILIVASTAAFLLSANAKRASLAELENGAEGAMRQVELRFSAAIESSKAVSYAGVVKTAYRNYQADGDEAVLYKRSNDYLAQNFTRDERVSAVYISFRDSSVPCPYIVSTYANNYLTLREYRDTVEKEALTLLGPNDTGIFFHVSNGKLYMVRNLLDQNFNSFAVLCMQLDTRVIFQALRGLLPGRDIVFVLDGQAYLLHTDDTVTLLEQMPEETDLVFTVSPDGHSIMFVAQAPEKTSLLEYYPELATSMVIAAVCVLPLLILMIALFKRHLTGPMDTLLDASDRVRDGERGYTIEATAPNAEFSAVYEEFNRMSLELKKQVEHIVLEQQALQQSRIKALQSQINPHFLNNTLEIINWESRLAGNDKVSNMVEALSTLLTAALDRNGSGTVTLKEELSYVESYLLIIKERLGNGMQSEIDADESLLGVRVPRLVLQPIAENAVEYDIVPMKGGRLAVRVRRNGERLRMEIGHTGRFTEEDRQQIAALLSAEETVPEAGACVGQIGLKNVYLRLRLIYGQKCDFTLEEVEPGYIQAGIEFPLENA